MPVSSMYLNIIRIIIIIIMYLNIIIIIVIMYLNIIRVETKIRKFCKNAVIGHWIHPIIGQVLLSL